MTNYNKLLHNTDKQQYKCEKYFEAAFSEE